MQRNLVLALGLASFAFAAGGCHATHAGSPQAPGTAALTSADVKMRIERVMVSDGKSVVVAARDGCVASISEANDVTGDMDELRVRCPQEQRMTAFFQGLDRMASSMAMAEHADIESEDAPAPTAQVITAGGVSLRATKAAEATKLASVVKVLEGELGRSEAPSPGPASPEGWQLMRVSGPAHVVFAGEALTGVLDARVSTSGQYLCEFMANTNDGPLRATKSGWIPPQHAARAIDEVLRPFQALAPDERPHTTYASAVQGGAERKASWASIPEVFERFGPFQDALGDACLPELDKPAPLGP